MKSAEARDAVLMVGPIPPPVGGMASFVQGILASEITERFEVRLLNTALSSKAQNSIWVRAWATTRFLRQLVSHLSCRRFRMVHIHAASSLRGFWEKAVMLLVCKAFRAKVILHIHGGGLYDRCQRSDPWTRQLICRTLNASDKVIVTSEHWRTRFLHIVESDRIAVVPNGVDPDDFRWGPREENAKTNILFVGTVNRQKGLYDILEALKLLRARTEKPFSFQIMGREVREGELGRIASLYKRAGIEEAVFLGTKLGEEKNRYFREAAIFVLPSHVEGTPVALLEAMAAGLPVVATRVGAIPELIEDGETGFLIEPGDHVSLAEKIGTLMDDPPLRRLMGARNRQRVEAQYSIKVTTQRTEALYREVLGASGRG